MTRVILLLTLVFGYIAGLFAFQEKAESGVRGLAEAYSGAEHLIEQP